MAEPLKTAEPVPATPVRDPKDVEENKDLAALSYAWIMAVVLLISKKHSPFVHFHAKQGTVLFILSVIFWLIPYANRGLELLVFFLMVWGFLASAQGHWTELPFVGPLARGKCTFRGSWKQTVAAIVHAKHWVVDLWTHHDRSQTGSTKDQGHKGAILTPTHKTFDKLSASTLPLTPSFPIQSDIPPVDSSTKL